MKNLYTDVGFDRFVNKVATFAEFESAREVVLSTDHFTDFKKVVKTQKLVLEAKEFFADNFKFEDFKMLDEIFIEIENEGIVTSNQITQILIMLENCNRIFEYSKEVNNRLNEVVSITKTLHDLRNFTVEISGFIDKRNGVIKKDASRELTFITATEEEAKNNLKIEFAKLAKTYSAKLTSTAPKIVNGRLALQVSKFYKDSIPGNILNEDATSMFVEPNNLYVLNNKALELSDKRQSELLVVMKRISALLRSELLAIKSNYYTISKMGVLKTFTDFYSKYKSCNAQNSVDNSITYSELAGINIVNPINISISNSAAVVNGATGSGKSSVMREIILNQIIHQCGLPVFAEHAKLPIYDEIIFIAEEEPKEQVKKVNAILESKSNVLAVVDDAVVKMNNTDATSMLISLLDIFKQKMSTICLVTNLTAVNTFAMEDEEISQFMIEHNGVKSNVAPNTFHTIAESSAFDDIELNGDLVDRFKKTKMKLEEETEASIIKANAIISESVAKEKDFENRMKNLNDQATALKLERREIEELKNAFEVEANFKVRQMVADAKVEIRKELNNEKEINKPFTAVRSDINQQDYQVGDVVELDSFHKKATVIELVGLNDIKVDMEGIIMTVHKYEVHAVNDLSVNKSIEIKSKTNKVRVPTHIEINDMNVINAVSKVEKYIKSSIVAQFKTVTIDVNDNSVGKVHKAIERYLDRSNELTYNVTNKVHAYTFNISFN